MPMTRCARCGADALAIELETSGELVLHIGCPVCETRAFTKSGKSVDIREVSAWELRNRRPVAT